ncbi:MAG: SMP-30/gluconolactonase/LRE family protein [Variibacter sp.]|nr:SMP-30/gluconolactonase/LRE family protein [Variibacter sp.]
MAWTFERIHGPLGRPAGGLAWDGGGMLFSDINDNVILRYDPATRAVAPSRKYTHRTNGLGYDSKGTLYGAQEGSRRIVRFEADGSAWLTTTKFDGQVHNHPCAIAIDRQDRVWFSDPYHAMPSFGPQVFPRLTHQSVLRLARNLSRSYFIERVTFDSVSPRGIALAPDDSVLYVAESDNTLGGLREIRAYPVRADGTVEGYSVLHRFADDRHGVHRGAEGLCTDADGHLFACAGWRRAGPGPRIYVFALGGGIVESHELPGDEPAFCAFGGAARDDLYVTTMAGELFVARGVGYRGR